MTNAHAARKWVLKTLRDEKAVLRHFVAVSTDTSKVEDPIPGKAGGPLPLPSTKVPRPPS